MRHINNGTCSRAVNFEVEDGIITACEFEGGCRGNTQGLSRMVIGRKAAEVADLLRGVQCRGGTSCPDQLSQALTEYLNAQQAK